MSVWQLRHLVRRGGSLYNNDAHDCNLEVNPAVEQQIIAGDDCTLDCLNPCLSSVCCLFACTHYNAVLNNQRMLLPTSVIISGNTSGNIVPPSGNKGLSPGRSPLSPMSVQGRSNQSNSPNPNNLHSNSNRSPNTNNRPVNTNMDRSLSNINAQPGISSPGALRNTMKQSSYSNNSTFRNSVRSPEYYK